MANSFVSLKKVMVALCGAFILAAPSAWCEEVQDTGKLTIHGFGSHESGQMVKGRWFYREIEHQWLMREFANLTANYVANEHFSLSAGITARIWYETYPIIDLQSWYPIKQYFTVYPHVASGLFNYNIGNIGKLEMEFGYFIFKYNPDVRNLGEYLFRCNTYPPSVITNFDMTYSRLSGGRISTTFMDMVNLHVLLTQQNELPSLYDPSLSVLADYNFKKIFDVGAGIMFDRFIAVDSLSTFAPGRLGVAPTTYFDTTDSTTKILGHGGTRVMSRFSFDVKQLLFSDGLGPFGKNDLRLYGEAAVLGLKDYLLYYDDIKKRIPRMIGFNFPCFNVLDLAAVELEYYGWNYSNGYHYLVIDGVAAPDPETAAYTARDYNNDNWKWTVYIKRTFYKHCYVLFQFANDHWVLPQYDEKKTVREEFCGRNTHWYWMTKFGVTF